MKFKINREELDTESIPSAATKWLLEQADENDELCAFDIGTKIAESKFSMNDIEDGLIEINFEDLEEISAFLAFVHKAIIVRNEAELVQWGYHPVIIDPAMPVAEILKAAIRHRSPVVVHGPEDELGWHLSKLNWSYKGEPISEKTFETLDEKMKYLTFYGDGPARQSFIDSYDGDRDDLIPLLAFCPWYQVPDRELFDKCVAWQQETDRDQFHDGVRNVIHRLEETDETVILLERDFEQDNVVRMAESLAKLKSIPRAVVSGDCDLVSKALSKVCNTDIVCIDPSAIHHSVPVSEWGTEGKIVIIGHGRHQFTAANYNEIPFEELKCRHLVCNKTHELLKDETIQIEVGYNRLRVGYGIPGVSTCIFAPHWKLI